MFKGYCCAKEVILQAVCFKLRFSLSYRDLENLLAIRGVRLDLDKSGANKKTIKTINKTSFRKIEIRPCKYLNNMVEEDHQFIKWRTKGMPGFKSFESASRTLTGIEMVRMIKKEAGHISFDNFLRNLLIRCMNHLVKKSFGS
ncbi:MAG: DDE-type integrase/transposase/recombinase [Chitinophagaceae bacterium]